MSYQRLREMPPPPLLPHPRHTQNWCDQFVCWHVALQHSHLRSMGFWPLYYIFSDGIYQSTRVIFSSWTHFNTRCHPCHMEQFNWVRLKNFLGGLNSPKYIQIDSTYQTEPTPKAHNVDFIIILYDFHLWVSMRWRVQSVTAETIYDCLFWPEKLSTADLLTDDKSECTLISRWFNLFYYWILSELTKAGYYHSIHIKLVFL